jgi:hypothetical protein
MFRTRDFILFFVTIVFLLLAIGATLLSNLKEEGENEVTLPKLSAVNDAKYSAEELKSEGVSRAERLSVMRQKIEDSKDILITESPLDDRVIEEEPLSEDESHGEQIANLLLCDNYSLFAGNWSGAEIMSDVIEGSRVFYTEKESETINNSSTSTSASSTYTVTKEITRNTKLQLPTSPFINGQRNCIPQDVVAVASQGSIIRNTEAGLYNLFGEETLIGYALDGWPIYGSTDRQLDNCGGTTVGGEYRYYLDSERRNILNCFVSTPVSI